MADLRRAAGQPVDLVLLDEAPALAAAVVDKTVRNDGRSHSLGGVR